LRSYVLITGATGGLGKAFAVECAARGWDLFLTDLSEEKLSALATGLDRLHGARVHFRARDLTDGEARARLWQDIDRLGLRFHMLINVAGLDFEGRFDNRQVQELRTMVRLNVESTVEMTRRVLPFRDPTRELRIINVASLAAFYPMPIKAVYAASKRFLLDWSLALRQELAPQGVTVTALCPAGLPTTDAVIRGIDAQGFMGRITTMNVGDVAARTIDKALAGRAVYVPGTINQVIRTLGALVPAAVLARMIGRRWTKSHTLSHRMTSTQADLSKLRAPVHVGEGA
jgi:short-subunit dehydrogenase